MQEFTDDELFEEIESFFLENLTDQPLKLRGAGGLQYDMDVFKQIRKFVNLLNEQYHTGLGIQEAKYQSKTLSNKQIEDCYFEATRKKLSYGEIMKNIHIFIFFLDELKYANKSVFDEMRKKGVKFAKFLKQLYTTDIGKKQQGLIKELETRFSEFNDYLEFYTQQSIGFEQHQKIDNIENDDASDELGLKIRQMQKLLSKIVIIKKQGFPQLVNRYINKLQNKHTDIKQWNALLRVIELFPLHIENTKFTPDELKSLLVELSNYIMFDIEDKHKEEFIQKIKMLFKKVEDKKMQGGSQNRVLQQELKKDYKKKIVIDIFKYNLQQHYSGILTKFNEIIQQKFMSQVNTLSANLRQITGSLKEVFTLLCARDYLEQDLTEFIDIIRKQDVYNRNDQQNDSLRMKFQYLKSEVDNIIQDAKNVSIGDGKGFTSEFIDNLKGISVEFQHLISYIKSLEDSQFDITDQQLEIFYKEIQNFDLVDMQDKISDMIDKIDGFINVSYLYNNIERTKKELATIDLTNYQDQSVKMFIKSRDDSQKYYKDLMQMYQRDDVVYDPTLALYMKEVLLKFHSCFYITRGISRKPHVNPRYYTDNLNQIGTLEIPTNVYQTPVQLIGITEEMGARQFKNKNRYQLVTDVFPGVEQYQNQLPENEQIQQIQMFLQDEIYNNIFYDRMIKYYDIFDIVQTERLNAADRGQFRQNLRVAILGQQPRRYRKEQLNRLYNQENGVPMFYQQPPGVAGPRVAVQVDITEGRTKINHLDSLLQLYDNAIVAGEQRVVTSFDNQTLYELLYPQIQVPFIQPFMKLKRLKLQSEIGQNEANTDELLFRKQFLALSQTYRGVDLREKHTTQYQLNVNVLRNYCFAYQGPQLFDTYKNGLNITSMLGVQLSVPQLYTPKGIFGVKVDLDISGDNALYTRFSQLFDRTNHRRWFNFNDQSLQNGKKHGVDLDIVLANDANINRSPVFIDIDTRSCQCIRGGINPILDDNCPVMQCKLNQVVQYQMYMAQQLQYFSAHYTNTIYDPMIRKKLFEITNTVYQGQPLLPGLDRKIRILDDTNVFENNIPQPPQLRNPISYYHHLDGGNLYLLLARPFGEGSIERSQLVINNLGNFQQGVTDDPSKFYFVNKGLYEDIPNDFLEAQPRVAIPIILITPINNILQQTLIDSCDKINPKLIENGVLRVDQNSIQQLISILDTHDNGKQLRAYLSSCVQIQYHNNYKYMIQQPQIEDNVQLNDQTELERDKVKFLEMARKTINIKQIGNAALIVLTDIINTSINDQVNQFQSKGKINYKSILDELNSLIIIYRQQGVQADEGYFKDFTEELQVLTQNNNYLNNYVHNQKTQANFYDNNHQIVGGVRNPPDHNKFSKYFEVLDKYLIKIKQMVHKLPIIDNFASLFTLIANHEGASKPIQKETIIRLLREYVISSMIDISESVLEFDFDVKLAPVRKIIRNNNLNEEQNRLTIKDTQLIVDNRSGKSIKLISPDCIFIPMQVDNHRGIVPQFVSQISRDFDQLFNQLMNAMSQRMLNHIGLYRFTQKKVITDTVQVSRIMLGIGKSKKRSKSSDRNKSESSKYNQDKLMVIDTRSELPINKFELYFRCYLLIKYYDQLFRDINQELQQQYNRNDAVKYFIYHFSPDSSSPEGKLFQIVSYLQGNNNGLVQQNQNAPRVMTIEDLEEFMKATDRIMSKYDLINNDQLYQKIVTYVNQQYGIISNIDRDQLINSRDVAQQTRISLGDFLQNNEQPNNIQLQVGDPRLRQLNNLVQSEVDVKNPLYTNIQKIILQTINKLNDICDFKRGGEFRDTQTISKYLQNQHKLLKIRNANIDDYKNNLLYIVNNLGENAMNDIQTPIMFHEQCLFAIELHNIICNIVKIKDELEHINPHKELLFIHPQRPQDLQENHIIMKNNKHVLSEFVDKMSDQQSLFAGSNMYQFNLNLQNKNILKPQRINENNLEDINNVAIADNQYLYTQNYMGFRNIMITQDSTKLINNLKQLRVIVSSILRNQRFRENLLELLKKHRGILEIARQQQDWQQDRNHPINRVTVPDVNNVDEVLNNEAQKENLLNQIRRNIDIIQNIMMPQLLELQNVTGRGQYVDGGDFSGPVNKDGPDYAQDNLVYEYADNNLEPEQVQNQIDAPVIIEEKIQPMQRIDKNNTKFYQLFNDQYKIFVEMLKKIKNNKVDPNSPKYNQYKNDPGLNFQVKSEKPANIDKKYQESVQNLLMVLPNESLNLICEYINKISDIAQDQEITLNMWYNPESNIKQIIEEKQIKIDKNMFDQVEFSLQLNDYNLNDSSIVLDLTKLNKEQTIKKGSMSLPLKGEGLGVNIPQGYDENQLQSNKLNLERPFFYNYNIYEGQLQNTDDVFVFNRLLKEFFMSCRSLTGNLDLLAQLFQGCVQEYRQQQNLYQQIHGREVKMTTIQEEVLLRKLQRNSNLQRNVFVDPGALRVPIAGRYRDEQIYENDPNNPANPAVRALILPQNMKMSNQIVQNQIKYNEMVNNVLYDGYHEIKDQFTYLDIEIHNAKQLDLNLQNLSIFTSSIFNFFLGWQQQQDLSRIQPVDLMTQLNMKLNHEDLQILVSNAVFTKYKLQLLVDKLVFKQNLVQHIAQQIFINRTQRRWNVDGTPNLTLRQNLINQQHFLHKIQIAIQHKIIPALDIIINNKHTVLPPIMQSGMSGGTQQQLVSNLIYLIDNEQTLKNLKIGYIQDENDLLKLNMARYLYSTFNKQNQESLMKQLQQNNNYEPIGRFQNLINMAIGHRYNLQNTVLNTETYYSRKVLLVPGYRYLKQNPEQYRNLVVPLEMMIKYDGENRPIPPAESSLGITQYRQYLNNNLDIYINPLSQKTFGRDLTVRNLDEINIEQHRGTINLQYKHFFGIDPNQSNDGGVNFINPPNPRIGVAGDGYGPQQFPFVYDRRTFLIQDKKKSLLGDRQLYLNGMQPLYTNLIAGFTIQRSLNNQFVRMPLTDQNFVNLLPIRINENQRLLYQKYSNYNQLNLSLPSINPRIFEEIISYLQRVTASNNILLKNITELGIMPINLQMLKRESGLVNMSLYASAFQQYLDRIQRQVLLPQNHPNQFRQAQYAKLFDINKLDMGLNKILSDGVPARGIVRNYRRDAQGNSQEIPGIGGLEYMENMLRIPEFAVIQQILANTHAIDQNIMRQNIVTMKLDHIRQSMQFRVALFLYIILKEMLGGVVHRDRDTYLHGIEALLSGQYERPMYDKSPRAVITGINTANQGNVRENIRRLY